MIIPLRLAPKSLTGHSLVGDRLVRFVYVDEAGISANEPVTVVAGLIVHGDRQWKSLEEYRRAVIARFIPPDDRDGFVFHAVELWNGGRYFVRDKWPLSVRLEILHALISAIPRFGLSVSIGYHPKDDGDSANLGHLFAYLFCLEGVENYMRSHAEPGEVALMVSEDTTAMRRVLKEMHHDMLDENRLQEMPDVLRKMGPIRHIVDTVHFAEKPQSALLQFADVCAFVARRYIAGYQHVTELMKLLAGGSEVEFPESGCKVLVHGQQAKYKHGKGSPQ